MEARHYTGLSNVSLQDDGLRFNVTLDTLEGPVPINAPVSEIGKFVHLMQKVSLASSQIRALPQHFESDGTLTLRPVDASALAVMHGEPGKALVVLLVGATTMAYSLDAKLLQDFAGRLQAVVGQIEPA